MQNRTDLDKLTKVLVKRISIESGASPVFRTVIGATDNFGHKNWNRAELVYSDAALKPQHIHAVMKGLQVIKRLRPTSKNKFRTHEGIYLFSPSKKNKDLDVRLTVWRSTFGDLQFLLAPLN